MERTFERKRKPMTKSRKAKRLFAKYILKGIEAVLMMFILFAVVLLMSTDWTMIF